jgi:hypothetical protein
VNGCHVIHLLPSLRTKTEKIVSGKIDLLSGGLSSAESFGQPDRANSSMEPLPAQAGKRQFDGPGSQLMAERDKSA